MEKLAKLLEAVKAQAKINRKVDEFARSEKAEEAAERVREEFVVLHQLSLTEIKEVRKEFVELQKKFRDCLSDAQKAMYDDLEALGLIISTSGQQEAK